MGYLPMDIILSNILPRLPAKSLTRFKCVSKSFLTEISSPKFIKLQQCNAMSSDSNRLLILPTGEGVYVYDLDSLHSLPSFCPYPKHKDYPPGLSIVASCDDYLLAEWGFISATDLILLNPSTRTYRQIPYQPFPVDNRHACTEVMVYNTKTHTWKLVESKTVVDTFVAYSSNYTPSVVQNHLLHLLFFVLDRDHHGVFIKRIGCFDMKAEQWAKDVQLPDVLWDKNGIDFCLHEPYDLCELDDQLCLMGYNAIKSSFDWWVMKDYGVKESWMKLMSLRVYCDLNGELCGEGYCPLVYRPGSPHELLIFIKGSGRNCKLYWYNLRDKEAIEAEFSLPLEGRRNWYFLAYICKGSLLDFPGARSIRVLLRDEEDSEEEDNE